MKSCELTGALLDYWVAKAEGAADVQLEDWGDGKMVCLTAERVPFRPSTNWADGGPVIERERMVFWSKGDEGWLSHPDGRPKCSMKGETHLIAAMRAHVANRFGEEVND